MLVAVERVWKNHKYNPAVYLRNKHTFWQRSLTILQQQDLRSVMELEVIPLDPRQNPDGLQDHVTDRCTQCVCVCVTVREQVCSGAVWAVNTTSDMVGNIYLC